MIPGRLSSALAERYRIERELGAGGMATVYLAEDLKHDRKVAIKVLKPELAAVLGAERFVVEIKTTASLQHPHILPLFDSGNADGFLFYVMPYIQGETIREKLNRETQFGVDEAVRIAREVADALDYAHRHGVIHRDIKPENILLHDGRAMVMDFGIALAVSAAAGGRMTETGLSLGTPHYMSPEQATAEKDISARSDVYSLASVLYEMLAGQPPHSGGSAQQIIMKIITDVARPVNELRRNVPPNVTSALARALEKLPADRFDNAKTFGDALVMPGFTHGITSPASYGRPAEGAKWQAWLPWGFAAVLGIVAIAGWLRGAAPTPLVRMDLGMGEVVPGPREVVISPDGSMLAVAGRLGGEQAIFVRRLDGEVGFRKLPGTETGLMPSFSPDNQWIVFRRNQTRELVKVSVAGGGTTTLVSAGAIDPFSPHWGTDNAIVFSSPQGNFRIAPGGGEPELLERLFGRTPFLLSDGSGVLFSINGIISLLDFARDTVYAVGVRGTHATVADDKLVFITESGALAAALFDRKSARVIGAPVVLVGRVGAAANVRGYSIARNGTLVFHDAPPSAFVGGGSANQMLVVTPGGPVDTLRLPTSRRLLPRFSPDGRRIAYEMSAASGTDNDTQLYMVDIVTGTNTQLTTAGDNDDVTWSPDGTRILFNRTSPGTGEDLWVLQVDTDNSQQQLTTLPGNQWPSGWPREDLVLISHRTGSGIDAYVWDPTGKTPPRPYLNAPWNESELAVSPDGGLAAFTSNERGAQGEIYVREFPMPQSKWRLTTGQSAAPRWSSDGRYLWWTHGGGGAGVDTVYRARVERTPSVKFGVPEVMYVADIDGISSWDLHPDGNRFVIMTRPIAAGPDGAVADNAMPRFILTLNWFNELRRELNAQR